MSNAYILCNSNGFLINFSTVSSIFVNMSLMLGLCILFLELSCLLHFFMSVMKCYKNITFLLHFPFFCVFFSTFRPLILEAHEFHVFYFFFYIFQILKKWFFYFFYFLCHVLKCIYNVFLLFSLLLVCFISFCVFIFYFKNRKLSKNHFFKFSIFRLTFLFFYFFYKKYFFSIIVILYLLILLRCFLTF